jgi:diadenylate cyclase
MSFPSTGWTDILDIIITAYIVYGVLLLIRGTRAVQILIGLLIVVGLRLLSQEFHLWTVYAILNGVLIASGVAIPIVFQPEIRRALAQLGRTGYLDPRSIRQDAERLQQVYQIIAQSAALLSRSSMGAIFVFERNTGLQEYVESGTRIDGLVSAELLLSIFSPRSPLHDGAVIIHRDRVHAAGCFLPLSESTLVERRLGTRHRAALGLSEQTDAVALVVSEETGGIVLVHDRIISENLGDPDTVAKALATALKMPSPPRFGGMLAFLRTLVSRHNGATDGVHTTELRS